MDTKVVNIDYDEENGIFQINGENKTHLEKDLPIREINKSRSVAKKTTLGDYDIYMLYQYYIKKFHGTVSLKEFDKIPLKTLFPNLDSKEYTLNNLMVKAYNALQDEQVEYFGNGGEEIILIIIILLLAGVLYSTRIK